MSRIDLFVAPEDYSQLGALGACWDRRSKCWYIDSTMPRERFADWLPDATTQGLPDEDLLIESPEAFVARARTDCRRCRHSIEVVCVYCRRGTVSGEPLEAFRVQCVWALDEDLRRQLQRWPGYRMDAREGIYLNHCPQCGAAQDEADLHDEPGQPFHDLCGEVPHGIELEALRGRVCLSGDYCIDV
ncbi:MAG TPA: DUF5710 domain-containing protein [Steroidobacteraceae bacterium]|jgi:hypothetical protein|nr:DUF5710 domain-containing protein [Steroidobacteraceae bacterium]